MNDLVIGLAGRSQQNTSSSQLDKNFDGVTNDLQKLSLSKDRLSPRNAEVDIEEWIRKTSAVAVAPDTLLSNEPRDTNSPTLTESSIANSIKVGGTTKYLYALRNCMFSCTIQSDCSQGTVDRLKQRVDYLESKLDKVSIIIMVFITFLGVCTVPYPVGVVSKAGYAQ